MVLLESDAPHSSEHVNLVVEHDLMRYWNWMECISSNQTQEELCLRYQRATSGERTPTHAYKKTQILYSEVTEISSAIYIIGALKVIAE